MREVVMKKVVFISSTGGHLSELLQLKDLFAEFKSTLITEKTKSNKDLKNQLAIPVYYLSYGTKQHLFSYLFIFTYNIFRSLYLFLKLHPDVVVTTGTHTAVPMCYWAHLFGKKVIWIETFANSKTPTSAGKLVYKIADTFVVQWESMKEVYPNAIVGGSIF